ncbi:MAG: hypothetical protein N4A45_12055 [Flavobacteriales bacterium]|nr:hypothetical protein [Flavobacteriales bacterium]
MEIVLVKSNNKIHSTLFSLLWFSTSIKHPNQGTSSNKLPKATRITIYSLSKLAPRIIDRMARK